MTYTLFAHRSIILCLFPRVYENTALPLCSHSEGQHWVPPHAHVSSGSTFSTVARFISPRFTLLWSPQLTYSLCIRCIMHEDYTGLWSRCVTLQSVLYQCVQVRLPMWGPEKEKCIKALYSSFFSYRLEGDDENTCVRWCIVWVLVRQFAVTWLLSM